MKKTTKNFISIIIPFLISASAFADECITGPQYAEASIQALMDRGLTDNKKYEYASQVTNSCQYEIFSALIRSGLTDVKNLELREVFITQLRSELFTV